MSKKSKKSKKNLTPAQKKRNRLVNNLLFGLIFLIGIGVVAFPIISQLSYWQAANAEINVFKEEVHQLDRTEIDRRMKLAHAYNEGLKTGELADPYSDQEIREGVAEYARMLEVNAQIATLTVPKISLELPLYAGTSESVLHKGLGHLEGTSLPVGGNSTHSVITGHRGLPDARLFTDLPELEIGDRFYIQNLGETIAYQVDQIKVIEPTDLSELLVSPGHDYVTLLTCTPYMVNSHRLLVRGHRIEYVEAVKEKEIRENNSKNLYRILFYVTFTILVLLILFLLIRWAKARRQAKKAKKAALLAESAAPQISEREGDDDQERSER